MEKRTLELRVALALADLVDQASNRTTPDPTPARQSRAPGTGGSESGRGTGSSVALGDKPPVTRLTNSLDVTDNR